MSDQNQQAEALAVWLEGVEHDTRVAFCERVLSAAMNLADVVMPPRILEGLPSGEVPADALSGRLWAIPHEVEVRPRPVDVVNAKVRQMTALGAPCPVTGKSPCPWHPDGGCHPAASGPTVADFAVDD